MISKMNVHRQSGLALAFSQEDDVFAPLNLAIELDPYDSEAHLQRGLAFARLGQIVESLVDLDRAIEIDSKNSEIHFYRGLMLTKLERNAEAILALEGAIKLDPNIGKYYHMYAAVLTGFDRDDEALEAIDRAVELEPSSQEFLSYRSEVISRIKTIELFNDAFYKGIDIDSEIFIEMKKSFVSLFEQLAIPSERWDEAAVEVIRSALKFKGPAKRPKWVDRKKNRKQYPELADLSSPEYLQKVWHDRFDEDGNIDASLVDDKELLKAVRTFIATKQGRSQDLGEAAKFRIIRGRTGRPARADAG